jgi:hypothetical protein
MSFPDRNTGAGSKPVKAMCDPYYFILNFPVTSRKSELGELSSQNAPSPSCPNICPNIQIIGSTVTCIAPLEFPQEFTRHVLPMSKKELSYVCLLLKQTPQFELCHSLLFTVMVSRSTQMCEILPLPPPHTHTEYTCDCEWHSPLSTASCVSQLCLASSLIRTRQWKLLAINSDLLAHVCLRKCFSYCLLIFETLHAFLTVPCMSQSALISSPFYS